MGIKIYCDLSAAIGTAKKLGVGSIRHMDVRMLWRQQKVKENIFEIVKEPIEKNIADFGTKNPTTKMLEQLLPVLGYRGSQLDVVKADRIAAGVALNRSPSVPVLGKCWQCLVR